MPTGQAVDPSSLHQVEAELSCWARGNIILVLAQKLVVPQISPCTTSNSLCITWSMAEACTAAPDPAKK